LCRNAEEVIEHLKEVNLVVFEEEEEWEEEEEEEWEEDEEW
jgi:hypothetical protein